MNNEDFNFEEMLEESLNRSDNFSVGDRVEGTIVSIGDETTFVDISGKSEAMMETIEIKNINGELTNSVGDHITAYIVSITRGEISITTNIGKGKASKEILNIAYKNEIIVHGTVASETKGGFNIMIGGVRCFCPFSQFDTRPVKDSSSILSKSFEFKIISYEEGGRNIILSRRVLLEIEKNKNLEILKTKLNIGDIMKGTIISTKNFGVFINIDGIEGLIPKSELSWSRNIKIES